MDDISALLQAIESVRPQLPDLVGAEWPQFEAQLNGYIKQLQDEPGRGPIVRAQIMLLFSHHEPARKRLAEAIAQYRGDGVTARGLKDVDDAPPAAPAMAAAPAPTPPAGERVATRYTDISCPQRVWLDTSRFTVVVRLTVQAPEQSAASTKLAGLREELPVTAVIEAPQFEVLGAKQQQITLVPDADSAPAVFDLRPCQVGHGDITLDFYQAGNAVGVATFTVEVVADKVAENIETRTTRPIKVEPNLAAPDRILHIAWNRAASELQFSLLQGAALNDGFRPVPINGDPSAHAAALYRQITSLVGAADPTVQAALQRELQIPYEDVDVRLKRLGQNLWRELIPDELKALYGREREQWRDSTLLLYADEPYFPWELVWPYEGGVWEDEGPWCQTLRLTRWLRKDDRGNGNATVPGSLPVSAMAVLAPSYSLLPGLPSAQLEQQALLDMMRERKLRDVSPDPATWQAVMNLLGTGGYDWIHVASHGNFYPEAPDGDSAIWLQADNALTPEQIAGMEIEGYLRDHRPAFFFNACEVGREGWALTHIGGWANRLVSCGAGVFVGPLWSVNDGSALTFANAFYTSLFAGETLASAAQQARMAARQVGDPTWLAYSVYGHPNARIVTG